MPRLVFTVDVRSDDIETDLTYLRILQKIFKGIVEDLAPYGYTQDESMAHSTVELVRGQ